MPSSLRTCPHCNALQPPEARFCRACGKSLPKETPAPEESAPTPVAPVEPAAPATAQSEAPSSQIPPEVFEYLRLKQRSCTFQIISILALTVAPLAAGVIFNVSAGEDPFPPFPPFILFAAVAFFGSIIIVSTSPDPYKAMAFLQSDRPLVVWVYTPEEWQQARRYFYAKSRDQTDYGCGIASLGLLGLLFGFVVGGSEYNAAGGVLTSIVIGVLIGGVLALPGYLYYRRIFSSLRRPQPPACVALGKTELFYEKIYWDTKEFPIEAITLKPGPPPFLLIEIVYRRKPTRYDRLRVSQMPNRILVPPRMASAVEAALPQIVTDSTKQEAERNA